MGIKSNIPMKEIEDILRDRIEKAQRVIIKTLKYVGEACVSEARSNGDYIDRTGNLRSSIGYVILNNGKIESENLKASSRGTDRTQGVSEARGFIRELSGKYNKGIVLIVVAGMKYASYVEATRNVLSSARLLAKKEVPRMLKEIGFK